MWQGLCQYLRSRAQPHPAPADSPVEENGAHSAAMITPSQVLGSLLTWSLILKHQLARVHDQNPVKPQRHDLQPI